MQTPGDAAREYVRPHAACAPESWIRTVAWKARLVDEPGAPAVSDAEVGTPQHRWTHLRVELDRDGESRVEFTHQGAMLAEDAGVSPCWEPIDHDYRNREERELFAERLRGQGDLSAGAATAVGPATDG